MALIFDIKRYAINDGPGVRTTIFIKGCPLRCVWCHNPESWSPKAQKLYKKSKCIGCQSCVSVCPMHAIELTPNGIMPTDSECIQCGLCAEECPTKAMEVCGKNYTMDELMAQIEKERVIMTDSHGGVTLCGGEPLMHADYSLEILRELGDKYIEAPIVDVFYHVSLADGREGEIVDITADGDYIVRIEDDGIEECISIQDIKEAHDCE